MTSDHIDLRDTGKFSSFFLDYLAGRPALEPFTGLPPKIASFEAQIQKKQFPLHHREVLVQALTDQYDAIEEVDKAIRNNIMLLRKENTYTVTTGHQLNLFTGPLYVIYKIVTVIRACEELRKTYPDYHFVPVYWMASEDHDFEEIDHFNFNGKTYRWDTDQQGAVGRFNLKDIGPLLQELSAVPSVFHAAYGAKRTLAEAVCRYMSTLFGEYGLVTIEPDNRALKGLIRPIMHADILEHAYKRVVDTSSQAIEALGYKTQINARETNFFYLAPQLRNRIEEQDGRFVVVDSDLSFTAEEMRAIIEETPEYLSPNVVLRPVYQEAILPNLAYVGGPSELVYWLQLKGVFAASEIPFPILLPRNFGLIVPAPTERKRQKTGVALQRFFQGMEKLATEVVQERTKRSLSMDESQAQVDALFNQMEANAGEIDATLVPHVNAQRTKTQKKIAAIGKKFTRAEKRNHEDLLRQMTDVYTSLFPGDGLQERHDNFLDFYQTDPKFIARLMKDFDPFDFRFNIQTYGD